MKAPPAVFTLVRLCPWSIERGLRPDLHRGSAHHQYCLTQAVQARSSHAVFFASTSASMALISARSFFTSSFTCPSRPVEKLETYTSAKSEIRYPRQSS